VPKGYTEIHTFQQLSAEFLLGACFPSNSFQGKAIPTGVGKNGYCFFKYLQMAKGVLSSQADEVARNGAHLR
jgi:hypothetical protein